MAGICGSMSRTVTSCPRSAATRASVSATEGHGKSSVLPTSKNTASVIYGS